MVKKSKKNRIGNLGKHGKQGGPGRPKGSKNHNGLNAVLDMFKDLVSTEPNLKKMREGLQEAMDKNPVGFYFRFVMPTLPKQVDLDAGEGGIVYIIPERLLPNKEKNAK